LRNAIVIFTKVPKTGKIKTRLTTDRGGILTAEEARQLYEACLLDVIDACVSSRSGDIYICHDQEGDRADLEQLLGKMSDPGAVKEITSDQGGNFDQRMQCAADYIFKDGGGDRLADSMMIIGGDLPSLQPAIVRQAAEKLQRLAASAAGQAAAKTAGGQADVGAAIVEGACQEGGFSIIGYTCTTPFKFDGVFYNMDGVTALDALANKSAEHDIPLGVVEMVPDVDIPVDLASLMPVLHALRLAARYDSTIQLPKRTIETLQEMGLESATTPPQREMV
jgi:glycosyltransferase A (GT-A) superfamily protein (DUF2064 family)